MWIGSGTECVPAIVAMQEEEEEEEEVSPAPIPHFNL